MSSRSIFLSDLPVNYVHSTILNLTNKPKLRVKKAKGQTSSIKLYLRQEPITEINEVRL